MIPGVLLLLRGIAAPGRPVSVATPDDRIAQLGDKVAALVLHLPKSESEPQEVMLRHPWVTSVIWSPW